MSAQDYAKLETMHIEALETTLWLLRAGSEYVHTSGLSNCLSRALSDVASSVENDGRAQICFEASRRVEKLLMFCDDTISLEYILVKNGIMSVVRRLRDLFIMRVQKHVPFGDPIAFQAGVDRALGAPVLLGSKTHSILMSSYRKTIWENFDDGVVFKSISEMKSNRGRKSGARKSKK